ncbi:MAG: type II toxin-antitoxin system RelE/ParE family toxin [Proteobacteria bacterium]|nr:type II toxin-antitoxin system RelE/ParE family toxin [Pseudomonadota bacterium]
MQEEILAGTRLLRKYGPHLGRPHVDTLSGTSLKNLKELRIQYKGDPWRILFAFDPKRCAILLVGGNKGRDKKWYHTHIPLAEMRFKKHLKKMEK